jgi:hypothetical protein
MAWLSFRIFIKVLTLIRSCPEVAFSFGVRTMVMAKRWCTTIQDAGDGSGDGILLFPDGLLEEMGWVEGDVLDCQFQDDGSVQLQEIAPPCSEK